MTYVYRGRDNSDKQLVKPYARQYNIKMFEHVDDNE